MSKQMAPLIATENMIVTSQFNLAAVQPEKELKNFILFIYLFKKNLAAVSC
jgi:hypothetical protein